MTSRLKIQTYLIFALSILVTACTAPAASPQTQEEMIKPGDKIGEMTLRQIKDESEQKPALKDYCTMYVPEAAEERTEECTIAFQPHIFLSMGVAASHPDYLDRDWQSLTWQISINGKPIDLEAFGTIDKNEDHRFWNILLDNPSSGPYELYEHVTTNDDPPERYALTLILNVSEP